MNLIVPTGTATDNGEIVLKYSEVGPVLEGVIEASRLAGVEFMWYSATPLCIFNPIIHGLGNKGCAACDGLLSVDYEGNVLPCSSWEAPVGNLLKQNFSAIWESNRAKAYRLKFHAPPGCSECDSFATCHGACPLYWDHFGHGELTGCFGKEA